GITCVTICWTYGIHGQISELFRIVLKETLQKYFSGQPTTDHKIGVDPLSVTLPAFHFGWIEEFLTNQRCRIDHVQHRGVVIGEPGFFQQVEIQVKRALYDDTNGSLIKKVLTF